MCKDCETCNHSKGHKVDFVGVEYDDYGTAFYFAYMYCGECDCSYDIDLSDEDTYLYYASQARRKRPRLGD